MKSAAHRAEMAAREVRREQRAAARLAQIEAERTFAEALRRALFGASS